MRWPYAVADDFFTKQLPNNVTWLLTLMYSLAQTGTLLTDTILGVLHRIRVLSRVPDIPASDRCLHGH